MRAYWRARVNAAYRFPGYTRICSGHLEDGPSMIFLAIGLLVVSVVLYALTGEGDTIAGLPRDDFLRLAGPLAILIFVMAGAARMTAGKASEALIALGRWMALGLVLVALYAYLRELCEVLGRGVQDLEACS